MTQLSAPVQILAVSGKQIPTKRGLSTIFEIKANDGREYSTFKEAVAQQANGLVNGQPVLLQYEETTNVKDGTTYTNYRLGDIIIPDGAGAVLPVNQANPTVTSIPAPVALTAAPVAAQSTIPVSVLTPEQKNTNIIRESAAKTAFDYAGAVGLDQPTAFALTVLVEDYIVRGRSAFEGPAPEPVQSPEPAQAGLTSTEIDW